MPRINDLMHLAKELERRIDGRAFVTIDRREVTMKLREISGEETTRLKSRLSEDLERALLEQGVRCFPRFQDTSTGDKIRLFRIRTVVASLVDMLIHPDESTDRELGEVSRKVKGVWDWGDGSTRRRAV